MIFVIIFYASILLSTIVVIRSLFSRSWQLMLTGLLLSLPFALYLSATPRFSLFYIYPISLLIITVLFFFRTRQINKS